LVGRAGDGYDGEMTATLRSATVPALDGIPGLVHGFEQRLGPPGWEEKHAGRRRMTAALEESGRLHLLKQVHGNAVRTAPWEGRPEADASVSARAGDLLGIETADCLPVLVVDPVRRAVAAAHAGWRGTVAEVTRRAVDALVAGGSRVDDLVAALGPGIGPCCYEVGEEVREAFGPAYASCFRPGARGRPHLDVRGANRLQLRAAGLRDDHIHSVDDCTYCRPDLYHSYRREGKDAGRMINFVGFARG
jgi:YfiH family protein